MHHNYKPITLSNSTLGSLPSEHFSIPFSQSHGTNLINYMLLDFFLSKQNGSIEKEGKNIYYFRAEYLNTR